MPLLTLIAVLLPVIPCCVRIRCLVRRGQTVRARRFCRVGGGALGGVIWCAMLVQEGILLRSGQLNWRTGLPLHLCSMMGVLSLPMLLTLRPALCHLAVYAGLPGGLLALIFPAALATPWPRWTLLSFCVLHAGLVAAPLLPLSLGWRPRPRGAIAAWGILACGAVAANAVNGLTGGNYLFLAAPIGGTPLMLLARWGQGTYRLLLCGLATVALAAEAGLVRLVCGK